MTDEEIQKQIEELECERMGYLEANNKAGARRKERKIEELENKLELKEIKQELELYKKFVNKKKLRDEFYSFMIVELAR